MDCMIDKFKINLISFYSSCISSDQRSNLHEIFRVMKSSLHIPIQHCRGIFHFLIEL